MMAGDVRIDLVYNNLPKVSPRVRRELAEHIGRTAKRIEERVHEKMREPKTGRVYVVGGKVHQASAKGEASAVLSGELMESVEAYEENDLTWIVPASGIQAWWEYGLRGYAARPYLRPAVVEERAAFNQGCRDAVKGAERV
jgi:hypothetical protein